MANLLVVDDHPDMRDVLVRILQIQGHTVRSVDSGESALKLLEGDLPHAVVIDERMHGMDGLEVVRRIRRDDRLKGLFLIVWSADGSHAEQSYRDGADEFWIKGSEAVLDSIAELNNKISARQKPPAP